MGSMSKAKKKNIPKSIHEMSKETLQETLKKKRECNAKALQTVEKLCESCVDEDWFLDNLQFINQCHFEDVTVERAITKICGYPLCNQKLEKVPSQQYHISTRYNKVFDISERKNFCSSCCYKSATHVKRQLFTSPLWFRDQEVIPKYTVLKSMKSSLGEEIIFLSDKIKPESDMAGEKSQDKSNSIKTVNLDKSTGELERKSGSGSGLDINDQNTYCFKTDKAKTIEKQNLHDIQKKVKETKSDVIQKTPVKDVKVLLPDEFKDSEPKIKTKNEHVDIIEKVEKCIFEWFSLDTFFYLYGKQKLKELLQDRAAAVKDIINSKLSLAGRTEKINRMIQLYGLLDADSFSSSEFKTNLKPLPDYSVLKEDGKTLEIKVRAFYQGQLQLKPPEKDKKEEEEETSTETEPNYLPLIDAHAQVALRKKIVLDKLNRVLPDLMKIFNTDYVLHMSEVRNLVSTFALSAHNITFKPAVWCLVGIILIKLLSIKEKELESTLKSECCESQVSLILIRFGLQRDYLDNLIIRLTDSTHLMEKLNDTNR